MQAIRIPISHHARKRLRQRGLSADDLEYVLGYGEPLHRTGVEFYQFLRRSTPARAARLGWW